jgi:DNA-binding PadR family transcriptional regulator
LHRIGSGDQIIRPGSHGPLAVGTKVLQRLSLLLQFVYFFITFEDMARGDSLSNFELMVMLVLIRLKDEAYGVPISKEISKQSGRDVPVGSVYATLERLEEKGLAKSEVGDPTPERGGRAKRYFAVTGKGLRVIRETQRTLVELWTGLPELEGRKA